MDFNKKKGGDVSKNIFFTYKGKTVLYVSILCVIFEIIFLSD